ncbi:hypothetical protein RZO55_11980 [Clostridium boliviensis]|uniref:DUF4836 family protein n=1 Tax=Clostridium boliviensis TaxID=318465 RepID=A0ABU4GMP7_9CLOT|nr:hypothetical protein [Clostridium boliviensis]MDW2798292.1 hypothetical protein [Clostridium boliviensis]
MIKKNKFALPIVAAILVTAAVSACSVNERSAIEEGKKAISEIQPILSKRDRALNVSQVTEPAGFDSPESAVKAYLEGLRDNDLKRMTDTFSEDANTDDIMRQYTILCGLDLEVEDSVIFNNKADAEAFVEKLDSSIKTADFGSMKLMGFVAPESLEEVYASQKHQENLIKAAQRYGGDKMVSCVAAVEVGDMKYLLIFDVIRKDGRWFNHQMGGIFANMLGIDREAVGSILLDTEDEKSLKQLLPDLSKNLLETEAVRGGEKSAVANIEAGGFDSSQMAAKSYLESLAANEQDKMIGAFAVESYVDHFDIQTRLESTGAYIFMQQEFDLPVVNGLTRYLNIQRRKKKIKWNILQQYAALGSYSGKDISDLAQSRELEVSSILLEMPYRLNLNTIKVLGYILPERISEFYGSDEFQNLRYQRMKDYGADNTESIAVVFEFDGARYLSCIDTVKYGDKWYVRELGGDLSSLLGLNSNYAGIIPLDFLKNQDIDSLVLPFN